MLQWLGGEEGGDEDDHHISFEDNPFLWTCFLCITIALVLMAGLMSGLTLGLMSLDKVELEVRLLVQCAFPRGQRAKDERADHCREQAGRQTREAATRVQRTKEAGGRVLQAGTQAGAVVSMHLVAKCPTTYRCKETRFLSPATCRQAYMMCASAIIYTETCWFHATGAEADRHSRGASVRDDHHASESTAYATPPCLDSCMVASHLLRVGRQMLGVVRSATWMIRDRQDGLAILETDRMAWPL